MPKVKVNRKIEDASVPEVEALWHDTTRWTGFVDGFGHLERAEGDWPSAGARVVWDSRPGGRGRVVERCSSYAPGQRLVCDIEDSELTATQTVEFESSGDGARITMQLDFTVKEGGLLTQVTQSLFVRGALKQSLRRTLARFDRELTAERELTGSAS